MAHPNYTDPTFIYGYTGAIANYKYVAGFIKWARVLRYLTPEYGWVICDSDGANLDYAATNSTGYILVNAHGSYQTLLA